MTQVKRYATVVLLESIDGFQKNQKGAVVEVYTTPYEAYDIEIVINEGKTLGLLEAVRPEQIQPLAIPQTALMKKWIKEGIQAQKLELALEAYSKRKTDLRGGAKMADMSYNRFAQEIEERRIIVLDDDGGFLGRLQFLADAFDDQMLREAIQEVVQESNSEQPSHQAA